MRGSIVERKAKDGKTLYYVVVRGRWHRLPGKPSRRRAESFLAQVVADTDRGIIGAAPTSISLKVFAEKWKAAHFSGLAPQTRVGYEGALKNRILPAFGERNISSIRKEDVQKWSAALRAELRSSTADWYVTILKTILSTAVEWEYISRNPVQKRRGETKDARRVSFLDPSQAGHLMAIAAEISPQIGAYIAMAITTGLRISELAAMRWPGLDEENRQYYVSETFVYTVAFKGFLPPKSSYSKASVVITPATMAALNSHRRAQAEQRLASANWKEGDFVFPGHAGGVAIPHHTRSSVFIPLLKKAELPPMRFHDLRHTCASLWISLGESAKFIQTQMRHSSIQTTFDVYGHLFPAHADAAAGRMDALLKG